MGQLYTSRGSEKASASHRVLHVFVCTSCNPNHLRVFRAQLPRRNPFYSSEHPDAQKILASLRKSGDKDKDLDSICCSSCGLHCSPEELACCAECKRLERLGERPAVFQERELTSAE